MVANQSGYIELTTDIVSAYVSNNHVQAVDLPTLITTVHTALARRTASPVPAEPVFEKPGAAQVRKSIGHHGLVSFLDGRTYKTLKRHLTANGLTPDTYCARYGLPADYPMVAPAYSERRSSLAKAIGLGVPGARAEQARHVVPAAKGRRRAA